MNGIKYVSNEKGEINAIILDVSQFKIDGIAASEVLEALNGLQQIIDSATVKNKKEATLWDEAKKNLEKLK